MDKPVSSAGRWVLREEYEGLKSFGKFKCKTKTCKNKEWTSARAFTIWKQGCRICNIDVLPTHMWKNDNTNTKQKRNETKKGHDGNRCEACKNGVCIERERPEQNIEIETEKKSEYNGCIPIENKQPSKKNFDKHVIIPIENKQPNKKKFDKHVMTIEEAYAYFLQE